MPDRILRSHARRDDLEGVVTSLDSQTFSQIKVAARSLSPLPSEPVVEENPSSASKSSSASSGSKSDKSSSWSSEKSSTADTPIPPPSIPTWLGIVVGLCVAVAIFLMADQFLRMQAQTKKLKTGMGKKARAHLAAVGKKRN